MPSTNTSNLNLEKPADGEQSGEWGDTVNSNMELIDAAVATKTGSETLTNKTLTSPVLNTGASGTAIKDEDNMASNSATHLATQQSIKAYVDSQVATEESIEDFVGGMVTGNTETGITVTYQDSDGTLDFAVTALPADDLTTGDAAINLTTTVGNITVDAQGNDTDIIFKGTDGTVDTTYLTLDGSEGGAATFTAGLNVVGSTVLASVDVTAVATAATFEPDGDTAADDNAAIGYTAAEGLILTGQGSTDDITIKNDADTTVLNVTTGGTNVEISAGNLLFGTASKGVYLGVDGATASNLLDDYEEGNWTCVVAASGGSFDDGAQSVTGTYTKTGRDVHVQAYVANVDTSGASGNLSFTGLPLSAAAVSIGSIGLFNMGAANAVGAWAQIAASGMAVVPHTNRDGSTWIQTTISAGGGRYANIDMTYQHDP
jgi:hypothetical protein